MFQICVACVFFLSPVVSPFVGELKIKTAVQMNELAEYCFEKCAHRVKSLEKSKKKQKKWANKKWKCATSDNFDFIVKSSKSKVWRRSTDLGIHKGIADSYRNRIT